MIELGSSRQSCQEQPVTTRRMLDEYTFQIPGMLLWIILGISLLALPGSTARFCSDLEFAELSVRHRDQPLPDVINESVQHIQRPAVAYFVY